MKRSVIILTYFLIFWIILPVLLILGARYLDGNIFNGSTLPASCKIAGLIIFITGLFFMLLSVFQFRIYGKEFPVSATPPEKLIQKGLFSIWRHPIYFFAIITVTGLALALQSYGFILIIVPVFIISVRIYIWHEEIELIKRFGPVYEKYKTITGLFIPKLYQWIKVVAFPFFKIMFRIRIHNKSNIPASPPFFVVASHRCYLDPFFISYALPWPVRHVSTFEMFRGRLNRRIFTMLGAISKKRYASDTKSIISVIHALDQGFPVGIFPGGERSWTGITQTSKPETLQMFKRFKHIPILPVRIEGNYFLWPRWSSRMLSSDLNISFEEIIRVTDDMGTEELDKILIEKIKPRDNIEQAMYCRSKNLTGNLSRVLYRCPCCRCMDTLKEIPPRTLKCQKCNQIIEIDRRFNLKYTLNGETLLRSIADLYNEIKVQPADIIKFEEPGLTTDERYLLADHVVFYRAQGMFYSEQNDTMVLIGSGIIILSDHGIFYMHDNEVTAVPFNNLGAVTIESYCKLQLYLTVEKHLYQVILKNESVVKWQDSIVSIMENSGFKRPVIR